MNNIEYILSENEKFVKSKGYEKYETTTLPNKELLIVSCMDSRLTEMLLPAMGLKNGDAKIIKNAGGLITSEHSDVIRSIIVATNYLQVKEIIIVMHFDCGMKKLNSEKLITNYGEELVKQFKIDNGIDNLDDWLSGFSDERNKLEQSVEFIKNCPLIDNDVKISSMIIDPRTGKLEFNS